MDLSIRLKRKDQQELIAFLRESRVIKEGCQLCKLHFPFKHVCDLLCELVLKALAKLVNTVHLQLIDHLRNNSEVLVVLNSQRSVLYVSCNFLREVTVTQQGPNVVDEAKSANEHLFRH